MQNDTFRWDFSPLDKFERTGSGGIRIPGFLSRAGVLTYKEPDGSVRKELRHPEVIFAKDSLDSLKHVAVTDGHRAVVDTNNWRSVAVGHVADDVRRDGDKIAATVIVEDAATIKKIEQGILKELSLGYTVDVEKEDGEFNGEQYTHKQKNPRYNHLAIGSENWGRAGKEVALRLDGSTYAEDAGKLSYVDPKEVEELKGKLAALEARNKDLETQVSRIDSTVADKVAASVSLREKAAKALGKVPEGDDKAVMSAVIVSRAKDFRADGLSDDALRAAFDLSLSLPHPGLATVQPVVQATQVPVEQRNDAAEAQERMVKRNRDMWKGNK